MVTRPFFGESAGPRSRGRRIGIRSGALLAVALIVAACGSAATPLPTPAPSATLVPSTSPSAWPTYSTEPTPSPNSSAVPSSAAGEFSIAMGQAALLAPAEDGGLSAGSQINDFGFDLLRRLDPNGNLCTSPTSIALALAMVRPGARGTTASQMDKVLHSFGAESQGAEIVALIKSLQNDTFYDDTYRPSDDAAATPDLTAKEPAVELDVSNAAFVQKGTAFQQAYLDAISSRFGAGVGLLDYRQDPEAARLTINKWASDRTKGRIPAVLQQGDVNNLTRIALANAIYLKAGWESPFDPQQTTLRPFTNAAGRKLSVQTMAIDTRFGYGTGAGYRAVELPYSGGLLRMTVIVPDEMASFIGGLSASKFSAISRSEVSAVVDLTLPKFSAQTRVNLAELLKTMGMPAAFDPQLADLSGITTEEALHLENVIHQANIDVVEEGTTAAAVTVATGVGMGAPGEPQHVQLHVDKPFLYFIHDGLSGAVLFMGRVDDPSI